MRGLARLIQDPVVLVDRGGLLLDMNGPARDLLGAPSAEPEVNLFRVADGLHGLLVQASGTAEPVIGVVSVPTSNGEMVRFRARAVVTLRSGPELQFAVQFLDTATDKFSDLTRRVDELHREIVARRAVQARLEEALKHNSILYRELQHRVKNHLQMMLGLFSSARREARNVTDGSVIESLKLKLRAICEAQQLMYLKDDAASVSAASLLKSLAGIFRTLATDLVQILVEADAVQIPNDAVFPLSLIINELLSNALKHGVAEKGDASMPR